MMMDMNIQDYVPKNIFNAQNPYVKKEENTDKLKEAANEFEAYFIGTLLEAMFEGIEGNDIMGGGGDEIPFRSMMIQEYSRKLAGPFGISDAICRQMTGNYNDSTTQTKGEKHNDTANESTRSHDPKKESTVNERSQRVVAYYKPTHYDCDPRNRVIA